MIRMVALWKRIWRTHWVWWLALPAAVTFCGLAVYRLWLESPYVAVVFVVACAAVLGLLSWLNFLDENGLMP